MKILKIIIWILFILVIVYVLTMFFVVDNEMVIAYNFNPDDSLRVSSLFPWYRLSPIHNFQDDYFQDIKAELIYFTVRIPPNFNNANLCVRFSGESVSIKLGAEKSKNKFEFIDTKISEINEDWKLACADFNLREFLISNYYFKNNRLTFAISSSGISDQNLLKLTEIDLKLTKKYNKNEFKNFYARIKNVIKK